MGTFTPTATFTPDFTPGPGLETPFGPENTFILHAVTDGESYPKLAAIYDTTVDILKTTNLIPEYIGLRSGIVIVVQPGVKVQNNLTSFTTMLVERPISIAEIAQEYRVNSEEIIYFNQINPEKTLPVGRYLIIPIKTSSP